MAKVLRIVDLSYKDFNIINLEFNNNAYCSIIGSNNCGKTTLFKLICGIIMSNNKVYCDNIPLNRENIYQYIVNLGIVERVNKKSFKYSNVIDEMIYPLHNLGLSKKYSIERIKEVLSLFKADDFINRSINSLNYYEKELLLIMIAILHKPKVLLLDSVLEVFPDNLKNKIIKTLKKLTNENMTIINFTCKLDEVYVSDKIILLDNFKIIGEYLPGDIYNNDKLFYEHHLEIPFITDLSIKLKMYNIIDKEYMNMKEMVDDIWP